MAPDPCSVYTSGLLRHRSASLHEHARSFANACLFWFHPLPSQALTVPLLVLLLLLLLSLLLPVLRRYYWRWRCSAAAAAACSAWPEIFAVPPYAYRPVL